MTVFKCKGCFKTFIKDKALSTHLQHRKLCTSMQYNLDFQTVISNHKQSKTATDKAPKSNLGNIDNRHKPSETNTAKQYNSKNENILKNIY